jgi:hypothetical protein
LVLDQEPSSPEGGAEERQTWRVGFKAQAMLAKIIAVEHCVERWTAAFDQARCLFVNNDLQGRGVGCRCDQMHLGWPVSREFLSMPVSLSASRPMIAKQ